MRANPTGLAIDATNAYWSNQAFTASTGFVLKTPLTSTGGAGAQLATSLVAPGAGGTVMKIATGGAGMPTTIASG